MSDVLLKMFCERYPPLDPHNTERLSTYPYGGGDWIERIYLELNENIFSDLIEDSSGPLIVPEDIEKLAEKIFDDIDYKFFYHQDEGYIISFKLPSGMDEYFESYSEHIISVQEPFYFPIIAFWTGNRGSIKLHDRQRDKYFQFANELYDIFMENALPFALDNLMDKYLDEIYIESADYEPMDVDITFDVATITLNVPVEMLKEYQELKGKDGDMPEPAEFWKDTKLAERLKDYDGTFNLHRTLPDVLKCLMGPVSGMYQRMQDPERMRMKIYEVPNTEIANQSLAGTQVSLEIFYT